MIAKANSTPELLTRTSNTSVPTHLFSALVHCHHLLSSYVLHSFSKRMPHVRLARPTREATNQVATSVYMYMYMHKGVMMMMMIVLCGVAMMMMMMMMMVLACVCVCVCV